MNRAEEIVLSKDIEFDRIPEKKFREFLLLIKDNDVKTFNDEAKDGFLDLYNYWNERKFRRFMDKHRENQRRWNT